MGKEKSERSQVENILFPEEAVEAPNSAGI
jgi:hypothetical protein